MQKTKEKKYIGVNCIRPLSKNKGITLVALVITIIIMLILSGIAISAITGDNGLFRKTEIALNINELGSVKEALDIYYVLNPETDPVTTQVSKGEITDEITQTKIVQYQPDVDFISDIAYERLYYLDGNKLEVKNMPEKKYIIDIETGAVFVNNGIEVKEDGTKTYVLGEYERDQNKTNILAEGTKIYTGNNNTYVVKGNGDLYGVGEISSYNYLGLGWRDEYDINLTPQKTDIKIVPENEATDNDFVEVKATNNGYLFRKKNGEVWSIGDNFAGQLGVGDTVDRTELTKCKIDNVKEIIIEPFEKSMVYFVKNDGTLWGVGKNIYYQYAKSWCAIKESNEGNYTEPIQISHKINGVEQFTDIKQISAAYIGTLVLKNNGELWLICGINAHYRFEESLMPNATVVKTPTRLTNIENIATQNNSSIKQISSTNATIVLLENGYLYTVGHGGYGLLCNGSGAYNTKFQKVLENVDSFTSSKPKGRENIHLKMKNGEVLGSGVEAGTTNTDTYIYKPTTMPINNIKEVINNMALTNDGKVYSLHYNYENIYNKQYININTPIKELFNNGMIDEEGYIWTFGNVLLKDKGKKIYLTKSNLTNVEKITRYGAVTNIIDKNRNIYGLGYNDNRVLQESDVRIYREKVLLDIPNNITDIREIAISENTLFIIDQNNQLWYRGNTMGAGGAEFGINGAESTPQLTKHAFISDVKKVYTDGSFTIVQKNDNTLWATGVNNYGELGTGNNELLFSFTQINKDNNGNIINFSNIKKFCCYNRSVRCLLEDGTIYVWGNNTKGELGLGIDDNVNVPTKVTFFQDKAKIVDVSQMVNSTVYLLENGDVYVSGSNSYGQLGNGTTINSNIPVKVNISDVKEIYSGRNHIVAIKKDNSIWSWGAGGQGQLGNGKLGNELSPVPAYELAR